MIGLAVTGLPSNMADLCSEPLALLNSYVFLFCMLLDLILNVFQYVRGDIEIPDKSYCGSG